MTDATMTGRPAALPRDGATFLPGIAAVVLWLAGIFLDPGIPDLFVDSGDAWLTFVRAEEGGLLVSRTALLLGDVAFIVFLGSLRVRLAAAEPAPGRWTAVAFGSGLVTAAMLIASSTPVLAADAAADGLAPAAAQALGVVEYAFFVGAEFSGAALLLATGVLAIRTTVLASWFGCASIVLALLMMVLVGPVGFIAVVLGLPLWVLVASILLRQRDVSGGPRGA